ncbi:hypothetical protein CerSpe_173350 [Prunus speciosa]
MGLMSIYYHPYHNPLKQAPGVRGLGPLKLVAWRVTYLLGVACVQAHMTNFRMPKSGFFSVENAEGIRQTMEAHFKNLFTTGGHRDWGDVLDCVSHIVSDEMNATLTSPILEVEVKDAVFQMGGMKAPGPDGFQGMFYQAYWDTILAEVQGTVKDFFEGVVSPVSLNSTYLVLIPKIPCPESVSQFRPIGLCNYLYKILSKIMANRLKPHMPNLIHHSQNACIPGRQIQDNIILAHEVFHYLKLRKSRKVFEMGVKLDMNKAYDHVEWDFLEAVMIRMGFTERWVELIMSCIKMGIKLSRSGPTLSHLMFADDTLIFLRASEQNCTNMVQLLNTYCRASGQQISLAKSTIFFSPNTPSNLGQQICHILGMPKVNDPGKYLGLPTIWGRSKREALMYIKERIMSKIQGWKQQLLSQAGREVLLKAVVQAVPAYPMHIFGFPSKICKEIDSLMANFWWGQSGNEKRIHWISWNSLGLSKQSGGMGFRDLHEFNLALIAKQCWRLITEPDSLWAKTLKGLYFPNENFLQARKGSRASWAWASLPQGRDILLQGAHWQVLDGSQVRLWVDYWIPGFEGGRLQPVANGMVDL